jgi:hypothetical protein
MDAQTQNACFVVKDEPRHPAIDQSESEALFSSLTTRIFILNPFFQEATQMKCLAVFLTLILYLAPAAAQTQDMPTDQLNAVKKLVIFYEYLGDSETAKKLQEGLNDGSIKFGPTPKGANAAINMKTKKININPAILKGVNSSDLESWRATADLASTVSHELTHKGQDKWAWNASYWTEIAGYGNACEQEAWSGTLEKVADWVRRVKNELDSKHNRSVREQAEAAKRLEMMCQAFEVLRND